MILSSEREIYCGRRIPGRVNMVPGKAVTVGKGVLSSNGAGVVVVVVLVLVVVVASTDLLRILSGGVKGGAGRPGRRVGSMTKGGADAAVFSPVDDGRRYTGVS